MRKLIAAGIFVSLLSLIIIQYSITRTEIEQVEKCVHTYVDGELLGIECSQVNVYKK